MNSRSSQKELKSPTRTSEKEVALHGEYSGRFYKSQHYLEAILDNSNMPVFLKDAKYQYLYTNRHFEHLAGLHHGQAIGKNDFDIFPESIAKLFREQDEEVINCLSLVEFEETITLTEGIRTFITSKFPLLDSQNNVFALGGFCTDITTRKKAESELREAEEKYRRIFTHSPLGILQIDENGIITASNNKLAEILGTSIDKIIGSNLLQSQKNVNVLEATKSVLSGQTVHYEDHYQLGADAGSVYLRGVFSPLFSHDGTIHAAIGIIEDITKRKATEESLQRACEDLERCVADRDAQLDEKREKLVETNVALKILLEQREEDKVELEERIMFNVEKLIHPFLEKLKLQQSEASKGALIQIIQSNIDEITSSFGHDHKSFYSRLTPAQIQIANLIKHGHTTKDIASLLNLSPATISCHRQEIRKRLSLTNRKINLQAALIANS